MPKAVVVAYSGKITAITFYSEYSARVTLDLLRAHNLIHYTPSITALCLSNAIADEVRVLAWKEINIPSS
ncbi:MAG: hypothetical protein V4482_04115 [Pseudomonadota bacterium]